MSDDVTLASVCMPTAQYDPRRRPDEEFDYVDISAIDLEDKSIRKPRVIIGNEAPSRARKQVKHGDVIVSTVRPNLNAVAQVPEALDESVVSTGFCVLRPNPTVLDSRYLYYCVQTDSFISQLVAQMRGASYPAVTDELVKAARITLSDLHTQRKIATWLDRIYALRAERRRCIKDLTALAEGLFHRMFGAAGLPELPLGELIVDGRYGTNAKCHSEPRGTPVLRIPNVVTGELDLTELKFAVMSQVEVERLALRNKDVLIVRSNGNRNYVGRCAVIEDDEQRAFASYLIRLRFDQSTIDSWYFRFFLSSAAGRILLEPWIRTTAGQSNLGLEALRSVVIPLPEIEAQREFAKHYRRMRHCHSAMRASQQDMDALWRAGLARIEQEGAYA
jgi:type I restriction enzyme S subunit